MRAPCLRRVQSFPLENQAVLVRERDKRVSVLPGAARSWRSMPADSGPVTVDLRTVATEVPHTAVGSKEKLNKRIHKSHVPLLHNARC